MKDVSPLRIHEVQTYFRVVAGITDDATLRARSYHNVANFTGDDYRRLADRLESLGSSATFAVLGRDAERLASTLRDLADRGHEIASHGYRHVQATSFPAADISENIQRGQGAIAAVTGIEPAGYFPPFREIGSVGTEAAVEAGHSWVFGHPTERPPDGLDVIEPVTPYDMQLLRQNPSPGTALDPLFDAIEAGRSFLFHPNMLAYFDATERFHDWLERAKPVAIRSQLDAGGVGLVIDANRPLRVG